MNYAGMTITLVILGFGAILWSYYKDDKSMPKTTKNDDNEDYYNEYGARIEELNHKIREMNEYGEFMKSELDKKHKELLFLYQMINEKSKDINGNSEVFNSVKEEMRLEVTNKEQFQPQTTMLEQKTEQLKTNHNQMILEFSEKGYSIKEIAQMLEIGQGEVKLVLDLFE
ncbi:MAG: hypothetical protein CVU84_02745 [Firmicutes bacterium HGW-Firmicutes-1]|nr:MAG: hypothetical protein CVU84_02745 [Firmicutes bacterium HGW-Firmicutes-1]